MTRDTEDIRETNAHAALWQSENYVSPSEREWLRWVKRVEQIVGHSLDGNQATDGYSLDFAYDAWKAGATAEGYAEEIGR